MAGGTKRLPRAVREQQMLDAAVQMFSVNGYHETSMDAIAAEAEISKPMLYLYYGSKEELFGACLDRELTRFVDEVRGKIDFSQSPKELLRNAVLAFLKYIDANRASWIVLYTQATSSQAFAHTVREGRERIIDLVGRLLRSGTRHPEPDTDFDMMAVALVGAGEDGVAGRGDDDLVEPAVVLDQAFDVLLGQGVAHRRQLGLEGRQQLGAAGPHRPRGPLLDDDARLEDLADVVERRRHDEGALLGVEPDQPLALEAEQRLPDRGARDAAGLGETALGDQRAAGQTAAEDVALDLGVDPVGGGGRGGRHVASKIDATARSR